MAFSRTVVLSNTEGDQILLFAAVRAIAGPLRVIGDTAEARHNLQAWGVTEDVEWLPADTQPEPGTLLFTVAK
ncbi:hypothetical protein [Metapseudomonas otitidis]|uniref:hypothetical protein n=1 Tax=Metapseudomonas otitidis TaxID=319939 RepID=UPI000D1AA27C|nr:hypothetical protein [Pseudomonas otitidis]